MKSTRKIFVGLLDFFAYGIGVVLWYEVTNELHTFTEWCERARLEWTIYLSNIYFSWITKFTSFGIGEFERFEQTMVE